ncbi:MAG TPA: hypothetical protein VM691_09375 [Myxococcales bacterium]|nr:hypothetical protein [Myxococcales bacterium]
MTRLQLVQFALLGDVYARRVLAVARPGIGVGANGEEEEKGTDLTRAAASALRKPASGVHFNVYFERRDLFSGEVDVVATDGFTGNVLLETAEGAVGAFGQLLERQIHDALSAAEAFAARRIEDELEEAAQRAAGLFEKNAA